MNMDKHDKNMLNFNRFNIDQSDNFEYNDYLLMKKYHLHMDNLDLYINIDWKQEKNSLNVENCYQYSYEDFY
jgi:hypothetical protein